MTVTYLNALITKLHALSLNVAAELTDIPDSWKHEFKEIEGELYQLSSEERRAALNEIEQRLNEIRESHQRGESNYVFFWLVKLKKGLQRTSLVSQRLVLHLDKSTLYRELLKEPRRTRKFSAPDSIPELIATSERFAGFELGPELRSGGVSDFRLPDNIPVIFTINTASLIETSSSQSIDIVTGHCIMGFEPNENKSSALAYAFKHRLLLSDYFVYRHVKTVADYLGSRLGKIFVNLDTIYYQYRLKEALLTSENAEFALSIVNQLADKQAEVVSEILPDATVQFEGHQPYKGTLDAIMSEGLLDFIVNEVRYFRGTDLAVNQDLAQSLGYVAATYLYLPLRYHKCVLSVESALNIEIPAQVVIPFLQAKGLQHLFSFVGLLPLADAKMAHVSMLYGRTPEGKLYTSNSAKEIEERVDAMSVNFDAPQGCWYTNFFLSCDNQLPDDECSPRLCGLHKAQILRAIHAKLASI